MAPAAVFETVLQRHVLDVWFPRCLDRTHGGYLCDFDRRWASVGPDEKLLEFVTRQLCVAADAQQRYPDDARFVEAVQYGWRCLKDMLWDPEYGGWFHRVSRDGKPLEAATKHAHGICYGLDACAAVYQATGDPAALKLAQSAFRWLEEHSHDPDHGGYFGFFTRQGSVIRDPSSLWSIESDTIGTPLGFKDLNVHSDLLETFQLLYRVWPDPLLEERLAEVMALMLEKFLVPSVGALHYYFTADWHPVPHLVRSGYQFQAAYRFTMGLDLLDRQDLRLQSACALLDNALRLAQDPGGGFYYAGPGTVPVGMEGGEARAPGKSWWVHFEGLKAFLALSRLAPAQRYREAFTATWRYIERWFLDRRFGGVYHNAIHQLSRWQRHSGLAWPAHVTRKGTDWKDARHESRALEYCIEHPLR